MLVVIFDRATSIHSSPTVSRSSSGISGADDSMPVDNVCSVIAGIFRASALRLADCVQGEPALLGVLLETLVPSSDANSFSSVEPGGAIRIREAVSDESLMSKRLRTEDALLSPSAQIAIFLFPQLGERSDLLAALTEQQHHVVLQDRD